MGMDLCPIKGRKQFRWNCFGWAIVLELAEKNGWKPKGTESHYNNWDGGYDTNDGQKVLKTDALNMAKALKEAVFQVNFDMGERIKEFIFWLKKSDGFKIY